MTGATTGADSRGRYRFLTADVFTDTPYTGNQLAVFPDARGLPAGRMQQIAAEFNFSETVFILPPDNAANFRRLRIFNPRSEMDFAGHPTIGAAHVLAAIGEVPRAGAESRVGLEEPAGVVPVAIQWNADEPGLVSLSAAKLPEVVAPPPDRALLAALLSLDESDVAPGSYQPATMSCGTAFILAPLRDAAAITRARANVSLFERELQGYASGKVFMFAADSLEPGAEIRARMFAPNSGIIEDAATGSAATVFGGYLAMQSPRGDGVWKWRVRQGVEMGRPSMLHVETEVSAGAVIRASVGGLSVIITEGMLRGA